VKPVIAGERQYTAQHEDAAKRFDGRDVDDARAVRGATQQRDRDARDGSVSQVDR
jgi:exosome complex RNA-binding protein Rrp42 (RNase PH superfamily)